MLEALFTHQLSHVWIDFRGIQDAFMREHGIDSALHERFSSRGEADFADTVLSALRHELAGHEERTGTTKGAA